MRTGPREGKGVYCPFCSGPLARPIPVEIGAGSTAEGGTCKCGARYLVDQTGKNVGELMMQALDIMGGMLSKEPSELAPGEDYDEVVLSYDWRLHRAFGEPTGFMDGHGRLYMFKVIRYQT